MKQKSGKKGENKKSLKFFKKLLKKCWQKGGGVTYYVSAAEEAVQNGPWKLNNKQRFKQQRISLITLINSKKVKEARKKLWLRY